MATLKLIFLLIMLGYTLYSVIVYFSRRSENKDAFRELKSHGQAVRNMTLEESATVLPFLVNPAKKNKIAPLESEQVYRIAGEYLQHGLSTSNGGETLHDTLGNVDVVLPYDARDFLQPWNTAEVVLTESFAIVISLNDSFDLKGGRERALLQQEQDKQWAAGQTGELPATGFLAQAPDIETTAEESAQELAQVRILGQREETAAEAALRDNPGLGWLPALLLVPAFILLLIAGNHDNIWPWTIPSLLLIAAALYLFWRPRKAASRLKINRVEGSLNLITLQNPGNSKVVQQQLFLGDKFPIKLPDHWDGLAEAPASGIADVDMRVDDFSVVRFGDKLSLDQEETRFPSIYWGRHLLLASISAAMLLLAWLNDVYDSKDLAHVRAVVQNSANQNLLDVGKVQTNPPQVGSMVQLSAQGRCQIMPAKGSQPGPISCDTLRWGGEAPKVPDVIIEPDLMRFYNGEIVRASENYMMGMVLGMQMAQQAGGNSLLMPQRPSIYNIRGLTELVQTIDKACVGNNYDLRLACEKTQDALGKKVIPGEAEDSIGWAKLLAKAGDGSLAKEGDGGVAVRETVYELRDGLRAMAEPRMQQAYAKALQDTLASQRGGIVLPILVTAQEAAPVDAAADAPAPAVDANTTDWLKQWANYQALAKSGKLQPVVLNGMVVRSEKDVRGDLVLEIDPLRNRENFMPALIRLLTVAMGAAFLLIHATLFVLNLNKAMQRSRQVAEYNKQRHASIF